MPFLRDSFLPQLVTLQETLKIRGSHYLGHVHQASLPADKLEQPTLRPTSLPVGLCGAAGLSCHSTAAALHVPITYMKCAEPAASWLGSFSVWAPRAFAAAAGFVGGGRQTADAAQAPISRFGEGLGSCAVLASGAMLALAVGFVVGASALVFFAAGLVAVPLFIFARGNTRPAAPPPAPPNASAKPPSLPKS